MAHATEAIDLYQRYGPALARKAARILLNQDDASDIVQALFLELLQRGRQDIDLPYLYRAVTNRCLNFLRDRDNRQRLLERQEPALRGPARTRLDDLVINLDLLTKLAGRLDGKSLEVLVCCYIDDMSQEEMAIYLGTSRKTIGKRLKKIRAHVLELAAPTAEGEA